MKKCAEIIFYSFVIALFSCCGNEKKKSQETSDVREMTIIPFEYHETYKLSEQASDSPTLKFDFMLSLVDAGDSTVTSNINQAIAYTLFESTGNSIEDACEKFIAQHKTEYKELLPDYINSKENDMPEVWFYNYYLANCEAETGYKGCINYTILWEEFTGGAHPNSFYTVLNFNPETGEEIVLSDILKDNYEDALTDILIKNLAKQLQVENIEGIKDKGYLYQDNDMFISNNFILDSAKIVFIYNKYEIAPYAFGDIMITVTYDELKDILK